MKTVIRSICLLLCLGLLWFVTKARLELVTVITEPPASAAPVMAETASEPAPTPEASPEPTPDAGPTFFTISAIGDCTLWSNANYADHPAGYAGVIDGDYSYPFSNTIQYFEGDDATLANLECTLSDTDLTYDYNNVVFPFLAPTAYASIMTLGGVDFVTTANNHMMDCFQTGADSTYAACEAVKLSYGTEGQAQLFTTDSGLVLGIYCSGTDLAPNKSKAVAAVQQLADEGAEYIICMFHWGQELYYEPSAAQLEVAHASVDAGADLVYGSHSHCLQPIEEYGDGLILYSMGNWTFGGNTAPSDPDTAIVQISVRRDADGSVSRDEYTIIPCCVSSNIDGAMNNSLNYNDYKPTPYEEGSEGYLRVMSKLDGSFEPSSQGKDYSDYYASRGG